MGKKKIAAIIVLSAAIITLVSFRYSGSDLTLVRTKQGLISGTVSAAGGVRVYKGIPFAAPPVGSLRWREPQPAAPWQGIKNCRQFSAGAMQAKPVPDGPYTAEFIPPPTPLSEDCLYLNVWTAEKRLAEKKPVIVWIHGGGFTGGSGAVALYDGEQMAIKGVVFVTINYRLGIFGFLAHPALSRESPHHVSGNYALLDQIAALQWVKDNIGAFGGDAGNVTIAGQSAGSCSVNALVASPLAKGLFKRAIAESGNFFRRHQLQTLQEAENDGVRTMSKLGAATAAAMRAMPAEDLLKDDYMRLPAVDGYVLPGQINDVFAKGSINDVDLLTGYNDGDSFMENDPLSAANFTAYAKNKYGEKAGKFLTRYPSGNDREAAASQEHVSKDLIFAFQHYTWAKAQAANGKKVYFYYFGRVPPGEPGFGAFHSAEIGYALHNLDKWNKPFTSWDKTLSNTMSSYWVNFAATGNPNGKGLPEWPRFTATDTKIVQFGDSIAVTGLPDTQGFEFFRDDQ